jgi:hypothetical protein
MDSLRKDSVKVVSFVSFTADSLKSDQWTNPEASKREAQLAAETLSEHTVQVIEELDERKELLRKKLTAYDNAIKKLDKDLLFAERIQKEYQGEVAKLKDKASRTLYASNDKE